MPLRVFLFMAVLWTTSGGVLWLTTRAVGLSGWSVVSHLLVLGFVFYLLVLLILGMRALGARSQVGGRERKAGGWYPLAIVWFSILYVLLVAQVLFYLSMQHWGLPMTVQLLLSQVQELPYLLKAISLPMEAFIGLNMLPLSLAGGLARWAAGASLSNSGYVLSGKFVRYLLLGVFITAVITVSFRSARRLAHDRFTFLQEPLTGLFLRSDKHQSTKEMPYGIAHERAAAAYPVRTDTEGPNVIFVICDALRSDRLSLAGYPRPTTPFLDSLFGTTAGSYYDSALFANSSQSFTGISAIMSSREQLTLRSFTLPHALQKSNYRARCILSGDFTNYYNLRYYLFDGVDEYSDGSTYREQPFAGPTSLNDDRILVIERLRHLEPARGDRPEFIYLHYMSVHQSTDAQTAYRLFEPSKFDYLRPDPVAVANSYDNGIHQFDAYLRRSFALLEERGYLENALIVVTSDHGQELLGNGHLGHSQAVTLAQTYIPLLIRWADGRPLPPFRGGAHDQTDIAPTVLDLLGLPLPASWEGSPLTDLNTPSGPIYQQQGAEYGLIQPFGNQTYQLVYETEGNTYRWTDVTDPIKAATIPSPDPATVATWTQQLHAHFRLPLPQNTLAARPSAD